MNGNYQILLMHEAVSPITQMEGTAGNVAVLMRQSTLTDGDVHRAPCLTGNGLRNRMLRDPSSHHIKLAYGLYGHLSTHLDRFLASGQERSVKGNAVDVGLLRRGYELLPHVRVLGGTVPSQVIPGRASVGFGVLCCRETRRQRQSLFPADWGVEERPLLSYQSMIELRQYTRKSDDTETELREGETRERGMMPFSIYTVVAGSVFLQRIDLRGCRDVDAGMVCRAIDDWDGTIGGQKSRGHGLLRSSYAILRDGARIEALPLIDAYEEHVERSRSEAIDWLFAAVGETAPGALE